MTKLSHPCQKWCDSDKPQSEDPEIDENFQADIQFRYAAGAERDPKGPSMQIIVCGILSNFPLDIQKFISVYRETDLYQKEWMAERVGGVMCLRTCSRVLMCVHKCA